MKATKIIASVSVRSVGLWSGSTTIAADPARRIEKEGREPMGDERAMGAA